MHRRIDPPTELLSLAAQQEQVVSLAQAAAHGMGRHSVARLVGEGRWTPLGRGIYHVRTGAPSWLALAWGGTLIAGQQARLGGAGAAFLHGLTPEPPDSVDLWVPGPSPIRSSGPWIVHGESPGRHSTRRVGDPPRLTVEDTVLDLVGITEDREDVVALVVGAVQKRRTSADRLSRVARERRRLRHRRLVEDVLAEAAEGVESPLERAYLHEVERAHDLPRGHRQHRGAGGRHRDVVYEAFGVVVELDGRFHEGAGRWRDMERDNAASLSGERTLRYGWYDVSGRPCLAARQVAHLVTLGGWSGVPTRCRRCRAVSW